MSEYETLADEIVELPGLPVPPARIKRSVAGQGRGGRIQLSAWQ